MFCSIHATARRDMLIDSNKFAQASRTRHRPLTPPAGAAGDGKGETGAISPSQWPQTFAASVADVPIPTVPLAPEQQD